MARKPLKVDTTDPNGIEADTNTGCANTNLANDACLCDLAERWQRRNF